MMNLKHSAVWMEISIRMGGQEACDGDSCVSRQFITIPVHHRFVFHPFCDRTQFVIRPRESIPKINQLFKTSYDATIINVIWNM